MQCVTEAHNKPKLLPLQKTLLSQRGESEKTPQQGIQPAPNNTMCHWSWQRRRCYIFIEIPIVTDINARQCDWLFLKATVFKVCSIRKTFLWIWAIIFKAFWSETLNNDVFFFFKFLSQLKLCVLLEICLICLGNTVWLRNENICSFNYV